MNIKIKLNGKKINCKEGKTILEVAKEHNIDIPTLCHDEELNPYGSCWVCAVEVKGRKGFVTSCGTKVSEGMEILTDSEEVYKARKLALELLLSDHYADCEAPCKLACPAKVDVQAYVSFIANKQYHEAVKIIKETLPMPLSIGRVCPAFCEEECRRSLVEEAIAIRQLKRYCADYDLNDVWSFIPEKENPKNKKIAVVGSGPSGLSCGYYLTQKGYDVVVYEASEQPGGWLRYGIPEYRLPKNILDAEINLMCTNGMQILTNNPVGKEITLRYLSENFDAVYLAIGAQKAVPMRVKGNDLEGCYLGVDFLKDYVMGKIDGIGNKVAVIGGGNTAVDCARTCRRLGAEVTIVYRRTKKEMPAEPFEIEASESEGIRFHLLTNPVEYMGKSGKIEQIKFEKMKLGEPDSSGRRRPEPTGEYFVEDYDAVIAAISQEPDVDFLTEEENIIDKKIIPLTRWSTADVSEKSLYTGIKNIFAGGDFRVGPATAVEAIADGKKASEIIDLFLSKDTDSFNEKVINFDDSKFLSKKAEKLKDINPDLYRLYRKYHRVVMPELEPDERINTFEEVEIGYNEENACFEAERCLECGCLVNACCSLRDQATEYNVSDFLLFGEKNKHPIDDSHPFILRDDNKCIKCGRCIRTCSEIQGAGVLGYIYRGFSTIVAPELGRSLIDTSCESCGKCIAVCPVGALVEKNSYLKLNPLEGTKTIQNCGLCGTGCFIEVKTQTDKIYNVSHPEKLDFNLKNLCFKGKFGWQVMQSENRINQPHLKIDGLWKPVIWENAIQLFKEKLSEYSSVEIITSPQNSNEELVLLREIGKKINTVPVTFSHQRIFTDKLRKHDNLFKNFDDLKHSDFIVIIGEINQTLRTLARNEQRKGKKLVLINDQDMVFNKFTDFEHIDKVNLCNNNNIDDVLTGLRNSNCSPDDCDCDPSCQKINPINLQFPAKTLFLYNRNMLSERTIMNIWKLSAVVCDFKSGSGIIETSEAANLNGFIRSEFKDTVKKDAEMIIAYGEMINNNILSKYNVKPFIVSFDTHFGEDYYADLIFPKPTYLELNGTGFTNDNNMTYYKNPKKSNLLNIILDTFYQAGLLEINKLEPEIWEKKVLMSLVKKCEETMINRKDLVKCLNKFEVNDTIDRFKTALSKEIDTLKTKTKGS